MKKLAELTARATRLLILTPLIILGTVGCILIILALAVEDSFKKMGVR